MKQKLLLITFLLASLNLFAQTNYTGTIDKYPIELVTYIYGDGVERAIYAYSNYDEPIVIDGNLKESKLILFEKDKNGKNKATLTFDNFDKTAKQLVGTWRDLNSSKAFKITLTKSFDLDDKEDTQWTKREIIQPFALKDKYFKLVISKEKDDFSAKVSGIKILQKKTDKLLQQIPLSCQLWGLDNISVEDYNFDGIADFSVFEQSYAGPNTSSLYFLFNPKTNQFFESGFSGTSLEFDHKTKRIYSHNQCCAGRSHMNEEYKVVNNKMVLVKKTCLEYDEKTSDYKKVKCD